MNRNWIKENLLTFCLVISGIVQLIVLIAIDFRSAQSSSKKFLPMTILPYTEIIEQKPKVVKKIKEVPKEEATEEAKEEEQQKTTQSVSESRPNPGTFMPFVRVDEIAKSRTSLMPAYPDLARNAGIEGTVILEVYIDENGIVRRVKVLKGIGFGADEAAIKKVKSTIFIPAKVGGRPVAVRQRITFEFRLN